jgi:hypothetical protein
MENLLDDFTSIRKDHSNSTAAPAEPTPVAEPSGSGQPDPSLPLDGAGQGGNPTPTPSGDPEPPAPPAPAADPNAATPEPPANPNEPEPPAEPKPHDKDITPDNGLFTTHEPDPEPPAIDPEPPLTLDFEALSEGTGYEIESQDDIVELVNSLKATDPYEGVSPLLRQAIELEQGGGDVKQFLSILSVDVDKLSDKQVLYEDYMAKNPALAEDREYAQQKFEREYNAKYGILGDEKLDVDFDTPEEYNAYLRDRDFVKKELAHEAKLSKDGLRKTQEDALANIPSASNEPSPEAQQIQEQYHEQSADYLERFETLQIPIDEEGKTFYNVPMNEESKPLLEGWAKNPAEFLETIGIPSDGGPIDTETLLTHMALTASLSVSGKNSFGNTLAAALTERINANTLEHQLENPAPPNTPAPAAGGGSPAGELAEAIDALAGSVREDRSRR